MNKAEEKRMKDFTKVLSISMVLLVVGYLVEHFKEKLPATGVLSPLVIVVILTAGYVHFKFSETMTYLYNLNPIGPRTTQRGNKIIGLVLLLVAGGYCIGILLFN